MYKLKAKGQRAQSPQQHDNREMRARRKKEIQTGNDSKAPFELTLTEFKVTIKPVKCEMHVRSYLV